MSFAQPSWSPVESTESPMIFTLRLSNSGLIFAMYPSSVVQTGVKSFGCENSTAHASPIQSWKRILPSVVSTSKSGAVSPILTVISSLLSGPAPHGLLRFRRHGRSRLGFLLSRGHPCEPSRHSRRILEHLEVGRRDARKIRVGRDGLEEVDFRVLVPRLSARPGVNSSVGVRGRVREPDLRHQARHLREDRRSLIGVRAPVGLAHASELKVDDLDVHVASFVYGRPPLLHPRERQRPIYCPP